MSAPADPVPAQPRSRPQPPAFDMAEPGCHCRCGCGLAPDPAADVPLCDMCRLDIHAGG